MAKYSSSPPRADAQLAEAQRRQQRRMVRQDAQLALDAGADDGVDVVREGQPLGRDDLEVERHRSAACSQLGGVLAHVVERAGEEEGLLGQVVGLALEDLLEATRPCP